MSQINPKCPELDIIIPFLNEYGALPHLIDELTRFSQQHPDLHFHVIFVDDGSTDGSHTYLQAQGNLPFPASLLILSKNFGSHSALRAGLTYSTAPYITFMYADLQDPLDLIPQMFSKIHKGCSIVWANRVGNSNVLWELFFSKIYSGLMRKFAVSNYPDTGFDVVIFTQQVRDLLNKNVESNSSLFLQILTYGFPQDTISYQKRARKSGTSKWTLSKKIKVFIDSFVTFSYAPVRLVSIIGIAFAIIGIIWMLIIVIQAFSIGGMVIGWPTLICVLLIGFGVTNFSLGILAEYLWRTLEAARNRPVFVVQSYSPINKEAQQNTIKNLSSELLH